MFLLYAILYFAIIFFCGWVFIVGDELYKMYIDRTLDDKIGGWLMKQDYMFVQLFPPAENDRSMAEMENFFINLAAIFRNISEKDMFLEGKTLETYSFEIHSRGGQVGFYIRLNRNYLPLLRGALSAHYPGAEVIETPDPLSSWPAEWNGQAGPYVKFSGTDITFGAKTDMHPMKSWKLFQREDNTPVSDPVSALITAMENIEPEDYVVLQFIIKPKIDGAKIKQWKEELKALRKEYKENASVEVDENGGIQVLTKQESAILTAAEYKIAGENFHTKIRGCFFTATGGPNRMLGPVMGYFKQFASELQFMKPDASTKTTASAESRIWGPFVDKHYWAREDQIREKRMYTNMKRRSFSAGSLPKYVNVESLAAMFHFPSTQLIDQSLASRVSTGEGAAGALTGGGSAPRDLPI